MVVAMTIVLVALMLAMAVLPVIAYKKGVEFGISCGIDELVKKERKKHGPKDKQNDKKALKVILDINNSKYMKKQRTVIQNIDNYDGSEKGQVKL